MGEIGLAWELKVAYLCQARGLGGTAKQKQPSNASRSVGMGQGTEYTENCEQPFIISNVWKDEAR